MRIGLRSVFLTFVLRCYPVSFEFWIGRRLGLFIDRSGIRITKSGKIYFKEG